MHLTPEDRFSKLPAARGIALFRLSRVPAMSSAIQTAIGALLKVDLC